VLVVQVHGNKRWQLFDEPEEYPIHEENKPVPAKRNVVFDEKLEAGDILYVPRGVYHRAEIESEDSLHLAVGINARKGVTFVQWLEKKLAQDSLLRQDIPVLAGAEELAEYELALKKRIAGELAAVSLADFLAEIDARRGKLVSFNFGPSPSPSEDDVVRALIRRRSAGRGYSAQANAIMEVLLPRVSMSFGELKSACVQGDDVLRSALGELAKAGVVSVTPATPERARI
jgi:ribosomal protein L16 Arg81 hydroxylase